MKAYKVGEKYDELKGPEGAQFSIDENVSTLFVRFPDATKEEIESIKSGNIKYGVTYLNDVIWLTWKFGDLNYLETPFSWGLLPSGITLQDIPEDLGLSVNIIMVDGISGELYANRLIGLSTLVSRTIHKLIAEQPYLVGNELDEKIITTQMRYDSNGINQLALATGKINRS